MARGADVARYRANALLLGFAQLTLATATLLVVGAATPARAAERCTQIRYAFQPDCFEAPCPPRRKLGDRLDLGPQVAVWIETADRSRFIDTVMVTNLTARFGLGNRPGRWDLPSGPRHPYGKRLMALPIWAWARGRLYPRVIMQDDHEEWMGFHEPISSPDPYYCRPMGLAEVDVDAISCPTKVFNSAKGKLANEMPMIPYPPRNDLMAPFTEKDCDQMGAGTLTCPKSAERFGTLNDLDAVAAATPAFERVFEGKWQATPGLAEAMEYALVVEVNREFDQNASYRPRAYEDEMLSRNGFTQTGLDNNLGQPSVIYRVPFRLDGSTPFATTATIAGYGAADGTNGMVRAPDSTISNGPGSGEGRLRTIPGPWSDQPGEPAKLFVRVDSCGEGASDCSPLPPAPPPVTDMVVVNPAATKATIEFRHPDPGAGVVLDYEIRRHPGITDATEQNFLEGVPVPRVDVGPPGTMASFELNDLKPLTAYVVAVRVLGKCGTQSPLTQVRFTTLDQQFKQLTGCFVATAAHGSALAPAVQTLRRVRDRVRAGSAIGATAVDLYERTSPPMAAALRESDPARAVIRQLLAPVVRLVGR